MGVPTAIILCSFSKEKEPKRPLSFKELFPVARLIPKIALAALLMIGPCAAGAAPKLERVVIVMRHGVRSPTAAPARLQPYAAETWPAWPVAPGELTPHGAKGATLAGAWLRTHYASLGLLPAGGCPAAGDIAVWSDGKDHRTVATGAALLDGFARGCGIANGHVAEGQSDPVFSAIGSGACPLQPGEVTSVLPALQAQLGQLPASYTSGMDALRAVLGPANCQAATEKCWWDEKNTVRVSGEGVKIRGPLATGASLAESLSLEFEEGMQGKSLGWGRLDAARLESIMAVHNLSSSLIRRNKILASHNGAVLAQRVLAALSAGDKPRLTLFVGHDTNLDNLAGIFGLDWPHPGQADATPPDGILAFELYRDPSGAQSVHIVFIYQTAVQLRENRPLGVQSVPGITPVLPESCGYSACSLGSLQATVGKLPCGQSR